jgi:hypothetical protein
VTVVAPLWLETHTVQAEANWSRWIVKCPVCPSALKLRPGTERFRCWDCDVEAEIIWPEEHMVAGIERLLAMRPNPINRNWLPGQTLIDLMWENGAHGVFDHLPPIDTPGGLLLSVSDGQIGADHLPRLPHLRELEG